MAKREYVIMVTCTLGAEYFQRYVRDIGHLVLEYPDATIFTDRREAMHIADSVARAWPDTNVYMYQDYGMDTETYVEICQGR